MKKNRKLMYHINKLSQTCYQGFEFVQFSQLYTVFIILPQTTIITSHIGTIPWLFATGKIQWNFTRQKCIKCFNNSMCYI